MMAVVARLLFFISVIINSEIVLTNEESDTDSSEIYKFNSVLISVLVRNKEHTLPFFLTYLERLDYPKDRISLLFYSDHNVDRSIEVLEKWMVANSHLYHSINGILDRVTGGLPGELGIAHWPNERYLHIISLREKAIATAREMWADYIWVLDADVFITNPNTLRQLISKGYAVSAPMLRSDGLYSNFWCGMTPDLYYLRTEEYSPILMRKIKGCHSVPMVHSAVLVDLRIMATESLTYDPERLHGYDGPLDDIITFARSANMSGMGMFVCNDEVYGYVMVPLEKDDGLNYDLLQLRNLKLEILVEGGPLEASELLEEYVRRPEEARLDIDKVFMINLRRRPDRRTRMHHSFEELQLQVVTVDAVDGQKLTDDALEKLGVKLMPGYKDPYHKRPMKRGEIGCFLSHYTIWLEIAKENYDVAMILEDDVRFEPFFNQKMIALINELKNLPFQWDLVYLGRKRLDEKGEDPVEGTSHLVWAGYSYWTLGYLLSSQGAKKLVAQDPLSNILPVDEYLPILYDKHPADDWKRFFPVRDVIALSAEPLVLYPAWYLHEEGYISDTEDSPTVTTHRPEL